MAFLKGRKGTEDLSEARLAQLEIVFETPLGGDGADLRGRLGG